MSGRLALCLFLLALALAACATSPHHPTRNAVGADSLVRQRLEGLWTNTGGTYRLRHSAMVALGENNIPMTGFMLLDSSKSLARLKTMTDFGLTLFAVDVAPHQAVLRTIAPALKHIPNFTDRAAEAVRRLFLPPCSDPTYLLQHEDVVYCTGADGQTTALAFDGSGRLSAVWDTDDRWRAEFREYSLMQNTSVPLSMTYEDRIAGYRLTLRQTKVASDVNTDVNKGVNTDE